MKVLESSVKEVSDNMPIVQMSIRIDEELRNNLKIHAIHKGIKINDLLTQYLSEGLERDKSKKQ